MELIKQRSVFAVFLMALMCLLLAVLFSSMPAYSQVKESVKVRGYDPDASVDCPDNYTYTAAKGCVASSGRVSQFSMDGRSPVIGLARCMPSISIAANPPTTLMESGYELSTAQMIQLEDGDIIAAKINSSRLVFRRYNAEMTPQSDLITIADDATDIGFDEHNSFRNDNLRLLDNLRVSPLDGARWVAVFVAQSPKNGEHYLMGAVINSDVLEQPSVDSLQGTNIFPISYEGKLFNDSATAAISGISATSFFDVEGFKAADGSRNGRFMVAWSREDYFKPSQSHSVFGKIFDENVGESSPSLRFGSLEQDSEIRLENTVGSLQNTVVRLQALRPTQGMALFYNDPNNYTNIFQGASETGAMRLFDSDGNLYREDNEVVGVLGDIREIVNVEELTSGLLMALHTSTPDPASRTRLSVSVINVTTPETPFLVDLNGASAGTAQTLANFSTNILKPSIEVLSDNRTRVYLTWGHDTGTGTIRSMMIRYNSTTPIFEQISHWFRVDAAGELPENPDLRVPLNEQHAIAPSLHTQTIDTPLGPEYHFITKYDRKGTPASAYRKYKVPSCW